ncbi:hypothetical protein [Bifidobacterium aquikefiri]|uniref:hypothetical protein n=1 Tax=Bifidobacterium aquikefiri TaxID=1653207 RepID=UPI0023F40956|nr:hypothetical protein [Bifidobacterium aquikefiri]
MQTINLYPASNDPRLPEWAKGILPVPPENVEGQAIICASADRILSLFQLTGDPNLNERLHEAVNDLMSPDLHDMDQISVVYWLHVIGWTLTDATFNIADSQVKNLVDDYHEICLCMALSPIRGVKGMTVSIAKF